MSDMTRTVFIGKPTKKDCEVYNLVLAAQENAMKAAQSGVKCAYPDKIARDTLGKKWNKHFIHTLGHGVGKRIHEHPKLFYKKDKYYLRENMVITIEPGVYVKNKFGIRIEDTCLVVQDKALPFTLSTKKLLTFKRP